MTTQKNQERRSLLIDDAEMRFSSDDDSPTLEGYASVFDTPYNLGTFSEVVQAGAFARAISETQDVRALIDHDPARVIGRTKNNTLELREDDRGLFTRIQLPDTQQGRDLATLVERGDLDAMSFGFTVTQDRWEKKDGHNTRYIQDVDLYDISVVAFPANPDTTLALRSLEGDQSIDLDMMRRRYNILLHNLRSNSWNGAI